MPISEQPIAAFAADLGARSPAPGGGAAAAVAAALGCAAGAMAARYTTGPRWAEAAPQAEGLATALDAARDELLRLAEADARAFGAVQDRRRAGDATGLAAAESEALGIPLAVARLCARHADALAAFAPRCNPQLASDIAVAVHLLAGAARAAGATLLANHPDRTLAVDLERCLTAARAAEELIA